MNRQTILTLLLALPLVVAGLPGCSSGRRNSPVDADKAREVLHTALESWKRGDKIDALQGGSPAIYVVDSQWQAGAILIDYRVVDPGKEMDALLSCPVVLTVRDSTGKQKDQSVTYYVSTAPKLTVARKLF